MTIKVIREGNIVYRGECGNCEAVYECSYDDLCLNFDCDDIKNDIICSDQIACLGCGSKVDMKETNVKGERKAISDVKTYGEFITNLGNDDGYEGMPEWGGPSGDF